MYSYWETSSGTISVLMAYAPFDSGYTFMRQSTDAWELSHVFCVTVDSDPVRTENLNIICCAFAPGSHLFGLAVA